MRNLRHILLLTLATLIACINLAHALAPTPAPLAGHVLDASTGLPLVNATLLLNDGQQVVSTDGKGCFEFLNLYPSEYRLEIRHLGYHEESRQVILSEGDAIRLLIALTPRPISLNTINLLNPAVDNTYSITESQIRSSNWSDLADAIRHLPGVQIFQNGGPGSRITVSLRGSRTNHVLVEVDGIPLNDGAGDAVDLSVIPLGTIANINVDPASQPGAPGGKINIRTHRSFNTSQPAWAASVEGQSVRATMATINANRHSPEGNGFSVYARYLQSDGDFAYSDEFDNVAKRINNDRERITVNLSGERIWRDLLVNLTAGFDAQDAGSPSPLYQPPTPEARLSEMAWRAHINIDQNLHTQNSARLTMFASGRRRSFISPREQFNPRTQMVILHAPVDISDSDVRGGLRYTHPIPILERGSWKLSSELIGEANVERFESRDQLGTASVSRTGGEVHRSTLSEESRLKVVWRGNRFRLQTQLDGRLDYVQDAVGKFETPFSTNGETFLSGRVLLRIAPSIGRWSTDIGAGSAYALPSFTNRFLVESVFALGNPKLKPERVQDIHCGLNWVQPLDDNSRLSGSLKGFLRNTHNLVVWQRNWRGQYYPDNLDQANAYGAELALSLRSDLLLKELNSAITWQNVYNATPKSPWFGNRVPFQAEMFGNVGGSLTITSQLDLLADLKFASRRFSRESNLDPLSATGAGMEPYAIFDLALRWQHRVAKSRLLITSTLGIDNISDARYELLERMPMPGRTWSLQLKLQQQ